MRLDLNFVNSIVFPLAVGYRQRFFLGPGLPDRKNLYNSRTIFYIILSALRHYEIINIITFRDADPVVLTTDEGATMKFYDLNKLESDEVNPSYFRKAVYGESLAVGRVEVQQGSVTQPHSHDTEEIIYVLRGAWMFHLPDGEVVVRDDQMICIPAGVEHSSEVLEDTVAIDICSKNRPDWRSGQDKPLHDNPEQFLWGV